MRKIKRRKKRICKYPNCHYYNKKSKTYCCNGCAHDHYDYVRLRGETEPKTEVKLKKSLRNVLSLIHNLPLKIKPAGHILEEKWVRFDYHITAKRGEQVGRITVMSTSPYKHSERENPFIDLSKNNKIRIIKRRK